jgi:hypothetical protein
MNYPAIVEETPEQQQPAPPPPLGSPRPNGAGTWTMCGAFFNFGTPNAQNTQTAGAQNLRISLVTDQQGNTSVFSIPYVYFSLQNWASCPTTAGTPEQLAANAINQAIASTNSLRQLGLGSNPAGNPTSPTNIDITRATFLVQLHNQFRTLASVCNPANSASIRADVFFPSQFAVWGHQASGTIYSNYSIFNTVCP